MGNVSEDIHYMKTPVSILVPLFLYLVFPDTRKGKQHLLWFCFSLDTE